MASLLNIRETVDTDDSSFDTALKLWSQYNHADDAAGSPKRLTFVAIERLTAIPFETVRWRVRGLEKRGWVIISDEIGIDLNIESPINQLIVGRCTLLRSRNLSNYFPRYANCFEYWFSDLFNIDDERLRIEL